MSNLKTASIEARKSEEQEIILGMGKFTVADIDIALTKGGGQFVVEREFRQIEADGMKAYGEDMIVIDREQPKLTVNQLSILTTADFTKLYSALQSKVVSEGGTGVEITSTDDLTIGAASYVPVTWTGVTNKGKKVIITLEKAINLENIDWSLVDKSEVINKLTYTGVAPKGETKAKWSVKFVK